MFLLILATLAALMLGWGPELASRFDRAAIDSLVSQAGTMGPLLIIGLMMLAVVASPLPSAPIALVSGAAYGHYAGTAYVAIGSELGAMIAFLIARYLGREAVVG